MVLLSAPFFVAACGADPPPSGDVAGGRGTGISSGPGESGRRLALVVGNDVYASMPVLLNAANDARLVTGALEAVGFTVETVLDATHSQLTAALGTFARTLRRDDVALVYFAGHGVQVDEVMSAALHRLGFEVTTELDADRVELIDALRAFTRRSAGADVSLVFYAGHGIEMNGVNYLVPVDARLERDVDVRYETATVDNLLVSTMGASLRLLLLDAGRNNPLARSMQRTAATRSVSGGSFADLNENLLGNETLVAYAAAAGTTAADGRGRNSPYTAALLPHLETPLEIRLLFRRVRAQVLADSPRSDPETEVTELPVAVLRELVEAGDAAAQAELGERYENGGEVVHDRRPVRDEGVDGRYRGLSDYRCEHGRRRRSVGRIRPPPPHLGGACHATDALYSREDGLKGNPDSARVVVAAGALLLMSMTVEAQVTFSRVITDPELGRFDFIVAVADINGDGRDDIVAGGREEHRFDGVPEDRFAKVPFHILVGREDGGFTHAPELVDGTIHAREAFVAASDFNGDGRVDLAVFDSGVYVWDGRAGYGNPPELWQSSHDGTLSFSEALADAVRAAHAAGPSSADKGISAPADLHLKSVTSGDIDGDSDSDLWVDSIGGKNVSSHFMVNNGDGTFTIDEARAPPALRHNSPGAWWYHLQGILVDLDNDGDLDLSLGNNRHTEDPAKRNSFSIVLLNDATGSYPERIELPRPAFNEGYTVVHGQTHADVNGDGFQDLLLLHTRTPYGNPDIIPYTGRYIQVLINDQGTSFVDETSTRMGDQSATTVKYDSDGFELYNEGAVSMHDVDRDGCEDIVVSKSWGIRAPAFPLVHRNSGSGQFTVMDPKLFAGDDRYFGAHVVPADVNGDGAIDFVVPQRDNGPDGEWGSEDDFTTLVTLLNTTPVGPGRCRPEGSVP